ncbi:MAG: starch-binding protein, partial [Phaeodactylibacter sp.]|nr:starch-binding protein [Phaeodactylibacter sp.]
CANIIFSDNSANQTADLSTCGEGWYDGSWHSSNPDAGGNGDLTLHFKPLSYSNPTFYYWNVTPTGATTTWPGDPMTAEGGGWYAYTLSGASCANFIFSNNGASQSPDLYGCAEAWYENGNWNPLQAEAPNPIGHWPAAVQAALLIVPNPTSSLTQVRIRCVQDGPVRLEVYGVDGRQRFQLFDGQLEAGLHQFQLDAQSLEAGVYWLQVTDPAGQRSEKVIVTQ